MRVGLESGRLDLRQRSKPDGNDVATLGPDIRWGPGTWCFVAKDHTTVPHEVLNGRWMEGSRVLRQREVVKIRSVSRKRVSEWTSAGSRFPAQAS